MSSSAKASTGCSTSSCACMSRRATPVVTSLGAYPTFNFHVAGFGGRLVTVPYENDRESLDGLLAAVRRENAPLVYLSNPDNPMGTWWEAAEIDALHRGAAGNHHAGARRSLWRDRRRLGACRRSTSARPNVLRMRTFSKAYGLAGIRCGYAIGERRGDRRLRKDPQPLRRQPHGADRRRRGAGRPGLSRRRSSARSRPAASASRHRAATTG